MSKFLKLSPIVLSYLALRMAGGQPLPYDAAYFENGIPGRTERLVLFPRDGPESTVSLPKVPRDFHLIAFGPDGHTLYGQRLDPGPGAGEGIVEIDLRSTVQHVVPGSVGLHTVWYLTLVAPEKIVASGWSKSFGECGTFELLLGSGTFRPLRVGRFPDCGEAGGPISPDGRRVLCSTRSQPGELKILNIETAEVLALGSGLTGAAWSPDGRWIGALEGSSESRSIVLIDTADTSVRKRLGRSSDSQIRWSPDSKYLLLIKQQGRQCGWFQSLETIELDTGERKEIESSHCKIFRNSVGWIRK
jgi:hypothetical protein